MREGGKGEREGSVSGEKGRSGREECTWEEVEMKEEHIENHEHTNIQLCIYIGTP